MGAAWVPWAGQGAWRSYTSPVVASDSLARYRPDPPVGDAVFQHLLFFSAALFHFESLPCPLSSSLPASSQASFDPQLLLPIPNQASQDCILSLSTGSLWPMSSFLPLVLSHNAFFQLPGGSWWQSSPSHASVRMISHNRVSLTAHSQTSTPSLSPFQSFPSQIYHFHH